MFGSVQSSFSSFLSTTAASIRMTDGGAGPNPPDVTYGTSRGATARPSGQEWHVGFTVRDAALILLYPPEAEGVPAVQSVPRVASVGWDYRPRLWLECGHIKASIGGHGSGWNMSLDIHGVECSEHLPVSVADAAAASFVLQEVIFHHLPSIPVYCSRPSQPACRGKGFGCFSPIAVLASSLVFSFSFLVRLPWRQLCRWRLNIPIADPIGLDVGKGTCTCRCTAYLA